MPYAESGKGRRAAAAIKDEKATGIDDKTLKAVATHKGLYEGGRLRPGARPGATIRKR
jgi:hypothetical protein